MIWYTALVLAVAAERLAELALALRNARWSLARGGTEAGRGHYPVMVALHTALLGGCLAEAGSPADRSSPGPAGAWWRWWSPRKGCAGGASAPSGAAGTPGSSSSRACPW